MDLIRRPYTLFLGLLLISSPGVQAQQPTGFESKLPTAIITTNIGDITVALATDKAPQTVANFISYSQSHYYSGLIFHRVVKEFVIQTGGHWYDLSYKAPKYEPVINESVDGLANLRGTIAMARGSDPNSADSQFFINLRDNPHLNAKDDKHGYTVFGRVINGMEVVDLIGNSAVYKASNSLTHVPVESIQIQSVTITQ